MKNTEQQRYFSSKVYGWRINLLTSWPHYYKIVSFVTLTFKSVDEFSLALPFNETGLSKNFSFVNIF